MLDSFLEYSDSDHKYYADGREVLSVTQILNLAGLVSDYAKDDEARWRGTEVHRLCAIDDDPTGLDLRTADKRLRGYVKAWRLYRQQSLFVPELIEWRVDDQINGYAGRLDRTGFIQGRMTPIILDLKTSKTGSVSDYVRYQLVAYAHAYKPNRIFERIAVALKPDGTYRCKTWPMHEFQTDLAKWLQILQTVREVKR